MRSLHVACMPFPTAQGTQGVVRSMLRALHEAGHEARLLVYADGNGDEELFPIDRLADFPRVRSQRSGPSLGKVALDLQMIHAVRRAQAKLNPNIIIAHNVEAALTCRAARVEFVYFAHTLFEEELETYAPRGARVLRRLGRGLDTLAQTATTFAIAPSLAKRLNAHYIPPPWTAPPADPGGESLVYVGNLDGYQGWEDVVRAYALLDTSRALVVGTASDPAPHLALSERLNVRVELAAIGTDAERATLYNRARLALVPRRSFGGLPIKLLDALARGVPVVATQRATAGLALEGALIVDDDSPSALAQGVRDALADMPRGGRAYIASNHAPSVFCQRFLDACARA